MFDTLYAAIAAELLAINAWVVPLVGEEHVKRLDPPPRMIFFPTSDTIGPPLGPGGNPRPIHDVLEESLCVIHARSRDVVAGMRDQFIVALRRVCKRASQGSVRAGNYTLGRGSWTRNTLIAKNGYEYQLPFAVVQPIVDRLWELSDPDAPAGPENPPTEPDASAAADATTYPVVPAEELTAIVDVGVHDDPPADDNVTITIPTPEEPEEPEP